MSDINGTPYGHSNWRVPCNGMLASSCEMSREVCKSAAGSAEIQRERDSKGADRENKCIFNSQGTKCIRELDVRVLISIRSTQHEHD